MQHATLLLDSSVENKHWDLAQDIVRFLKSIDPSDTDAPPPLAFNLINNCKYATSPTAVPPMDQEGFTFSSVSNVGRIRSSSVTAESAVRDSAKEKPKLIHTRSDNQVGQKR